MQTFCVKRIQGGTTASRKEGEEVSIKLLLNNSRLLGYVDTVQEFTDILVPYTADTLDRRSYNVCEHTPQT